MSLVARYHTPVLFLGSRPCDQVDGQRDIASTTGRPAVAAKLTGAKHRPITPATCCFRATATHNQISWKQSELHIDCSKPATRHDSAWIWGMVSQRHPLQQSAHTTSPIPAALHRISPIQSLTLRCVRSHENAFTTTKCVSVETPVRRRPPLFAGLLMHTNESLVPKRVVSEKLADGVKHGRNIWKTDCKMYLDGNLEVSNAQLSHQQCYDNAWQYMVAAGVATVMETYYQKRMRMISI